MTRLRRISSSSSWGWVRRILECRWDQWNVSGRTWWQI